MSEEQEESRIIQARKALEKLQNFDVSQLPREDDLGKQLSFSDAVEPAERLINLYILLSPEVLEILPDQQLENIRNHAQEILDWFDKILNFNPKEHDQAFSVRDQYVDGMRNLYQKHFNLLHPLVSFGLSKSTDLKELERRARLSIQGIEAKTGQILKELEDTRDKSQRLLDDVRKVAAEQGVSQHSIYFNDEANQHKADSVTWRYSVIGLALITVAYAVGSLFFHLVIPTNDLYQSVQLIVSKILIFAVLLTLFLLAIKNFLSHKHNEIINRHRQNALLTYQSLVDATPDDSLSREIVLSHAASCIFSPQETGYTKSEKSAPSSGSEFIPRPTWRVGHPGDGA